MAKKTSIRKVPPKIAGKLMFKSDSQCCVCQKKGDHIHHLAGRVSNDLDNLALLCYEHHNQASLTGTLSKKLSKEAIINYRDHHYKVIANKRQKALNAFRTPIFKLDEEILLTANKNAIIILEIAKIKEDFWEADWDNRAEILSNISKFSDHSNNRIAFEVFEFLEDITCQTRANMPYRMAIAIYFYILNFFPVFYYKKEKAKTMEIAHLAVHIGHNMAYDATIHLRNLAVAQVGLTVLKFMYRTAKQSEVPELIKMVNHAYDELERTLKRPERNDLENALELVKVFRNDLNEWDLAFPPLPKHLEDIVNIDCLK
ncbi:MAG: HNH endonuclease [Bacteroidetes bacterium]|nr:HNH endonuclease [Bacteroidota bacterium]